MKHLMTLIAGIALISFISLVAARPAMGAGKSYGGGHGGSNGMEGTISDVQGSAFLMTAGKDKGVTYKVKCDPNTKFMSEGKQVSPSVIKVGAHVGVQGGQSGTEILATTVTILPEGHKKK